MQARLDDFDKQLASRAHRVEPRVLRHRNGRRAGQERRDRAGRAVRICSSSASVARSFRRVSWTRTAFTPIDTREVHAIQVPDTTKRYQIVSRQSLDDVKVATREGTSFRGSLEIPDAEKFWAASRYLIIVQK